MDAPALAARHGGTEDFEHASIRDIEQDIERTRNRLASGIVELERQLSPEHLIRQLALPMQRGGRELGEQLMNRISANPLPGVLMATGVACLLSVERARSPENGSSECHGVHGGIANRGGQGTFVRAHGQPLALAAVGLMFGAVAGALLPLAPPPAHPPGATKPAPPQ